MARRKIAAARFEVRITGAPSNRVRYTRETANRIAVQLQAERPERKVNVIEHDPKPARFGPHTETR